MFGENSTGDGEAQCISTGDGEVQCISTGDGARGPVHFNW